MKKKIIIVCSLVVIAVFAGFVIYKHNKKTDIDNAREKEEIQKEVDKAEKVSKNVSGLTVGIFDTIDIGHVATIEERDFENEQKKWLIVSIEDAEKWQEINEQKKEEVMQGLINISRLQIDRDFGGVQILFEDAMIMQGWWSDEGYVIL